MKKRILPFKTLLRTCPVCRNASKGFVLHTQSFVLPRGHLLSRASTYDIVSCRNCGFVYADTPLQQKTYDKYYGQMSKYEMAYDKTEVLKYRAQAERINAVMKDKNAAIIDVGAGNGGLLLEMKKLGYKNLTALDPSEKCVENIRLHGIRAQTGSVFRHRIKDTFDLVILSHVMEHLVDVDKAMRALTGMAGERGMIYIEVPDAAGYAENHFVPFYFFDTEHINHFDEVSLMNLGLSHGLRTLHLGRSRIQINETTKYPVIHIAYRRGEVAIDWEKCSRDRILAYIRHSGKENSLKRVIDKLRKENKKILIWGAGNFTMRLLDNSSLAQCDIIGFVDKDPKKQGGIILDKPVYGTDYVKRLSSNATIVVCSAVFSEQILKELKKMKVKNKVVVLK